MVVASDGLVVWESLAVVSGGIVAAAVALGGLAKAPGGRWLFRRLVADPLRDLVAELVDQEVHVAVEVSVDQHLDDRLAPLVEAVEQINVAVNHVGPGAPQLKDRVAAIERSQQRIEGQLTVVREIVERIVGRL
jgi:hypothetical protein